MVLIDSFCKVMRKDNFLFDKSNDKQRMRYLSLLLSKDLEIAEEIQPQIDSN